MRTKGRLGIVVRRSLIDTNALSGPTEYPCKRPSLRNVAGELLPIGLLQRLDGNSPSMASLPVPHALQFRDQRAEYDPAGIGGTGSRQRIELNSNTLATEAPEAVEDGRCDDEPRRKGEFDQHRQSTAGRHEVQNLRVSWPITSHEPRKP